MTEEAPSWLTYRIIRVIHRNQLAEHGGGPGLRDEGALEATVERPKQRHYYAKDPDLFDFAAAYASGMVLNHPFVDSNKCTGFLAAYVFLSMNDTEIDLPEQDVVLAVNGLAVGDITEEEFADWLRDSLPQIGFGFFH